MMRITRRQAIETLRYCFLRIVDDQHCMCEQADRHGFYCRGFGRFPLDELRRRYYWVAREHPDVTRSELKRLANIWQLERQQTLGTKLSCDTQTIEHDTCRGWDEHTDDDLARWVFEFTGREVEVVADRKATG